MRKEIIGDATLYLGDCLEILPTLSRFDACITDPPYNCGKNYGIHNDSMDRETYAQWLADRWAVLPTDTLLYTPGNRNVWDVPRIFERSGFKLAQPLAWHKKEFAGDKYAAGPAMSWEIVVWAYRTRKQVAKLYGHAGRDHLTVNSIHGNPYSRLHPCPKPVEVPLWLIQLFSPMSVLDPMMGTGTTGEAAVRLGRSFVGIEIEPRHFETACGRIERAQAQKALPLLKAIPARQACFTADFLQANVQSHP